MTGRPGGKHERFAWAYRLRDGKIFNVLGDAAVFG